LVLEGRIFNPGKIQNSYKLLKYNLIVDKYFVIDEFDTDPMDDKGK
jgi:hypothetical protein